MTLKAKVRGCYRVNLEDAFVLVKDNMVLSADTDIRMNESRM